LSSWRRMLARVFMARRKRSDNQLPFLAR
jgi:hypothetical protein